MATILIVDDEAPVRHFLAIVLIEAGYTTIEAINGREALTVLQTQRPDLIITDVMMPLMGGVQLTREVKARESTRHIPVIIMSAAGPRVADGAGAEAFIDKPFMLDDMEALVKRWLPQAQAG